MLLFGTVTLSADSTSLPDQLFDRLVAAILDGRYAPGDRLPSQRALAAEFGVNMASLRAAVDRLKQLRLVEVRHGEPMRVADWRRSGGLEILAYAAGTEPALMVSLFEARAILLREAARLAADRATEDQRRELTSLAAAFAGATDDDVRQETDFAFMAGLIDASGNLVFTLIVNSMRASYLAQKDAYRAMVTATETLAPAYAAVAAAVEAGEAANAAAAMDRLTAEHLALLLGAAQ